MMTPHANANGARCRRCGTDAHSAQIVLVDRITVHDDVGPSDILFHFCEPCLMGFDDALARLSYVRAYLAS